jgi:hypothetical protein
MVRSLWAQTRFESVSFISASTTQAFSPILKHKGATRPTRHTRIDVEARRCERSDRLTANYLAKTAKIECRWRNCVSSKLRQATTVAMARDLPVKEEVESNALFRSKHASTTPTPSSRPASTPPRGSSKIPFAGCRLRRFSSVNDVAASAHHRFACASTGGCCARCRLWHRIELRRIAGRGGAKRAGAGI